MYNKVFKTIEKDIQKYLDFLCNICGFIATAEDKKIIDAMIDNIVDFTRKEGFESCRTKMNECGDFYQLI